MFDFFHQFFDLGAELVNPFAKLINPLPKLINPFAEIHDNRGQLIEVLFHSLLEIVIAHR